MTDGALLTFDCGVENVEGVAARGGGAAITGLAFAFKAIGASSFCGGVAKAGFRIVLITLRDTSTTKSPPSAINAIMLGQSRRSKLKAAKELMTRRRLSFNLHVSPESLSDRQRNIPRDWHVHSCVYTRILRGRQSYRQRRSTVRSIGSDPATTPAGGYTRPPTA